MLNNINISTRKQDIIGLLLYAILLAIGMSQHEPWMDESHHWLVARTSATWMELYQNYQYEGHPMVWVTLLWGIGKLTHSFYAVQLLHYLITLAAASLFLFKAPFSRGYKIAFLFSYYFLFEYGLLSRNYSVALLFLFLFCYTYIRSPNRPVLFFLCLGALANSHLFGWLASFFLLLLLLIEQPTAIRTYKSGGIVFLTLAIFAFVCIQTPSDHFFYFDFTQNFSVHRLAGVFNMINKAFLPFPDIAAAHYWNTNYLSANLELFSVILTSILWLLPIVYFHQKKYALFFYGYAFAVGILILLTGLHITQRVSGFLLFFFIALAWIEREKYKQASSSPSRKKLKKIGIVLFLIVQLTSTIVLYWTDIQKPFSNTKAIAHTLVDNPMIVQKPVYAGLYCNYIGINNYVDIKLHISQESPQQKFCNWAILPTSIANKKNTIQQAIEMMESYQYPAIVLLSPYVLPSIALDGYELLLIEQKTGGIVKNEDAYIYLLQKTIE